MRRNELVIVASLLLLCGRVGWADFDQKNLKIEIGPGFSIPNDGKVDTVFGTAKVDYDSAAALVLSGVYRFHPWFSGGLELFKTSVHDVKSIEFPDIDGDGRPETLTRVSGDVGSSIFAFGPILRAGKETRLGRIRLDPYGSIGVGGYVVQQNGGTLVLSGTSSTGITGQASLPVEDDSSTFLGSDIGVGLGFPVGNHFEFSWDLRWNFIWASGHDIHTYLPSFRLAYQF